MVVAELAPLLPPEYSVLPNVGMGQSSGASVETF
jgi:hypothetical protein